MIRLFTPFWQPIFSARVSSRQLTNVPYLVRDAVNGAARGGDFCIAKIQPVPLTASRPDVR